MKLKVLALVMARALVGHRGNGPMQFVSTRWYTITDGMALMAQPGRY